MLDIMRMRKEPMQGESSRATLSAWHSVASEVTSPGNADIWAWLKSLCGVLTRKSDIASRTCHEIIIKTFLIVFRQIYTITYRLFKISTFNAFVKLTKAVTFLFVICQILSPMTN